MAVAVEPRAKMMNVTSARGGPTGLGRGHRAVRHCFDLIHEAAQRDLETLVGGAHCRMAFENAEGHHHPLMRFLRIGICASHIIQGGRQPQLKRKDMTVQLLDLLLETHRLRLHASYNFR